MLGDRTGDGIELLIPCGAFLKERLTVEEFVYNQTEGPDITLVAVAVVDEVFRRQVV